MIIQDVILSSNDALLGVALLRKEATKPVIGGLRLEFFGYNPESDNTIRRRKNKKIDIKCL